MSRADYYNDDGTASKTQCPRCGDTFLADHSDREHCGKCGYTEWK
ncbi:30S ribosomal protein S27ae [Halarchaeum nitratireducens]|uniref:Small ribosomal subunit protein eS31 n=1 Tax=Halarchaeum nitratireducens TaxID=489913 RepID=A0A830GBD2_9EURY|nr:MULTISPECIES: 30S ribosomal protein S27ae [Halarchaeum]MBP2250318.1 small subunit ribosomal protein S27Ae [Halarchaeum solikamskense]GGN12689.1 30S ribosomal protein S27ae [Halarchaeum nitratireducens]